MQWSGKKPAPNLGGRYLNQNWMSPVVRWTDQPVFHHERVTDHTEGDKSLRMGDWFRRALNILVAGLSLLLTAPFLIIIALAVKLSSPGPVLFEQDRVGLNRRSRPRDRRVRNRGTTDRRKDDAGGEVFRIYKFRTMYREEGSSRQVWAKRNDLRVTRVGRLLRAFRLDELPQLFNVLLGHMNIVGPRPEQPEIFRELRAEISDYAARQSILPGITGLAQVNNGYDQTVEDVKRKLRYDLEYLERQSAAEDLRIMAKTVLVVFSRKGSR